MLIIFKFLTAFYKWICILTDDLIIWFTDPLLINTVFLKNEFEKIKFDKLDFYCLRSLQKSIQKLIFAG